PSVLTCAARLPWSGPPLIATAGWPNTAVLALCRQLAELGTELLYHGDFDPPGIDITRLLHERIGVRPWRMTAADYLAAAATSKTAFREAVSPTPWAPDLAQHMRSLGKIVYEE